MWIHSMQLEIKFCHKNYEQVIGDAIALRMHYIQYGSNIMIKTKATHWRCGCSPKSLRTYWKDDLHQKMTHKSSGMRLQCEYGAFNFRPRSSCNIPRNVNALRTACIEITLKKYTQLICIAIQSELIACSFEARWSYIHAHIISDALGMSKHYMQLRKNIFTCFMFKYWRRDCSLRTLRIAWKRYRHKKSHLNH